LLKDWVVKSFGDAHSTESTYVPGTYYKRICRPLATSGSFHKAISQEKLNQSFVSLKILLNKLEELFETIEPTSQNLQVYGHKIREILLLACMEVESSWTAVLKKNGYSPEGHLTTNDYVKLANPMFLDGYKLFLQQYPNFPPFSPYGSWNANDPTKTLPWYDAYNRTKHDRENNLNLATLNNAINAVGAAVIMFHAQFGFNFDPSYQSQRTSLIRSIFRIITEGFKKYNKELYIPKIDLEISPQGHMSPKVSWEWNALNFPF